MPTFDHLRRLRAPITKNAVPMDVYWQLSSPVAQPRTRDLPRQISNSLCHRKRLLPANIRVRRVIHLDTRPRQTVIDSTHSRVFLPSCLVTGHFAMTRKKLLFPFWHPSRQRLVMVSISVMVVFLFGLYLHFVSMCALSTVFSFFYLHKLLFFFVLFPLCPCLS